MTIQRVALSDDLNAICAQLQPHTWGEDNEMKSYEPERLKAHLAAGGMLVLARDGDQIIGAVLAYILQHPADADSLYIHELDAHPNYRRQGVGRALMRTMFDIARERGLTEVWVLTEQDNEPAKALYTAVHPDEMVPSVMYAYKVH